MLCDVPVAVSLSFSLKSKSHSYYITNYKVVPTFREDFGNRLSQRGLLCHHQNSSHFERSANRSSVKLQAVTS